MKSLLYCSVTVDMTDDEIKEMIHKMYRRVDEVGHGFLFTVAGYNNDPRELWEIPEVIAFFKRLIDIGFLSVLEPVAQIADPGGPAFGALEVWMVATGQINEKKDHEITREMVGQLFTDVLYPSNMKLNKLLSEPCPKTGICEAEHIFSNSGGENPVSDGQHHRKIH
jgi:hypothetical protein